MSRDAEFVVVDTATTTFERDLKIAILRGHGIEPLSAAGLRMDEFALSMDLMHGAGEILVPRAALEDARVALRTEARGA